MNRRTLLKLLGTLLALGTLPHRPARSPLRFHVAGARFHGPAREVRQVSLRPTQFRGEKAIAVYVESGEQIGWVPRALVAPVAATRATGARVVGFTPDGLPWRWYQVEVS